MAKPPEKSNKFKYNLQNVLQFRELRETQEQEKFVKAQQEFQSEKQKEDELKDFQNQKYTELHNEMASGQIDFQQIFMRRSHLDIVKEQVIEQEKVREDAEEKKDHQREELVKAVKDKEILEKDKEKKRDQWKDLMKKEENKFLDEISAIGFVKKTRLAQEALEEQRSNEEKRREHDERMTAAQSNNNDKNNPKDDDSPLDSDPKYNPRSDT